MGIQRKLSTAAHPQTDGQTERTNQTLEQYLKAFVNYKQDNWANLIHFAEMAMNNAVSSSTKRTPFEINLGYSPRFDYLAGDKDLSVPAADIFINSLNEIWIDTIKNLRETASRMKRNTDNLRREHNFMVGDFVYLKRNRPSGKLDYKRIGPYEVIECINKNAFRLRLPKGSRQHSVFNVSKLTPFVEPKASSDEIEPHPDLVDGFEEFEVEAILDSRMEGTRKLYLVKWKGYSDQNYIIRGNRKKIWKIARRFYRSISVSQGIKLGNVMQLGIAYGEENSVTNIELRHICLLLIVTNKSI